MTQSEQTGTPTWYNEPPEWAKQLSTRNNVGTPPPRQGGYEAGRQDQELLTAIRSMPEQVVNALRSAIEAATPQQQQKPQEQQQQSPPEQQQQQNTAGDNPPNHGATFADKWFSNKLFSS